MIPIDGSETLPFQCPGEAGRISKAVHLARMASGYSACQHCEHRTETFTLPTSKKPADHSTPTRGCRVVDGSLRGVYLNDLTRETMALTVAEIVRVAFEKVADKKRVVVGNDWRESSPDLVVGLVKALRRAGCHVADVGRVSRSCFDFAISGLHPDMGLYLTGGNQPSHWNGIDLVNNVGGAMFTDGQLEAIVRNGGSQSTFPTETYGPYESLFPEESYRTILQEAFHAVRPVSMVLASLEPTVSNHLSWIHDWTPCVIHHVTQSGNGSGDTMEQFTHELISRHADVGFFIDRNGTSLHVIDETGQALSPESLQKISDQTIAQKDVNDERSSRWGENDPLLRIAAVLQGFSASDVVMSSYRR